MGVTQFITTPWTGSELRNLQQSCLGRQHKSDEILGDLMYKVRKSLSGGDTEYAKMHQSQVYGSVIYSKLAY